MALSLIKIKKGLDLPLSGLPKQTIDTGARPRSVGIVGEDYPGMKPTMHVQIGDSVSKGQALFSDKKNEGVLFTSPISGEISGINRGNKRALLSVTIDVGDGAEKEFSRYADDQLIGLERNLVRDQLVNSGHWTAIRTRPYSKVPSIKSAPNSIFVTAMDSNPLSGNVNLIILEASKEFQAGLQILTCLTDGPVFVCEGPEEEVTIPDNPRVVSQRFSGPHPAGLPGTHIHYLDPVGPNKCVWYVNYQDVIGFGHLFLTGRILSDRIISLAGPGAENPRLIRTTLGANLTELVAGELQEGDQRVISGSVLSGRTSKSPTDFLGRYHSQVSVLNQDKSREFIGYLRPGLAKHSVFPVFLSKWLGEKEIKFSTSTNGSPRAMVPIGTYDSVMPLDILATQLLRSLLVGDIESAINLGCLELDEEDLALCTYSCPGKYEYGPVLREMLTQIEREG